MSKIRLLPHNLWRGGTILGQSSQSPQFPSIDTQIDTKQMFWRSSSLGSPDYISCDIGEFSPAGIGTMNYDSGDVEPIVGEWLFGELASGKVVSVTKDSGEWGSNTAVGSIILEKCEGCFNDNEDIRGSIGGANMLTVNHPDGAVGVDKLVKNGAFVSTADEWSAGNSATLTCEAGGKVGNCLMIEENGTNYPYGYQEFSVTPGMICKLNAFVKAGTEAIYKWYISDATHEVYIKGLTQGEETAGDWSTKIEYTFEVPADCVTVRVAFYNWTTGVGTTIYFDEISLYELDEDDTKKKADSIAILGHNFSQTAVIKAIGSMESDFSDEVEEVVIPYNEDNIFYFFPAAVTRRYWKAEVTDADNPDGHIQAATISLGKYFEPEWSFIKPHSEGRDIASELEFTDSMVLYAHKKPTRKVWLLNFRLTEAEKDEVLELIEENENHEAFIACFDSDNPNSKSCLVKLRAVEEPEYSSYDRWRWEAPIIEVL